MCGLTECRLSWPALAAGHVVVSDCLMSGEFRAREMQHQCHYTLQLEAAAGAPSKAGSVRLPHRRRRRTRAWKTAYASPLACVVDSVALGARHYRGHGRLTSTCSKCCSKDGSALHCRHDLVLSSSCARWCRGWAACASAVSTAAVYECWDNVCGFQPHTLACVRDYTSGSSVERGIAGHAHLFHCH